MIPLIAASLVIMIASLSGVAFASKKLSGVVEKNIHYLISFSAGIFLVVALGLSKESLEHAITESEGLFWIGAGLIITWLILKLVPESHHHHAEDGEHRHHTLDAKRIVFADAIHNFADGILLASAFSINVTFGIIVASSILIHEILAEISEYFVMREAGWDAKKSLAVNFMTSSTILLGALGAYFVIGITDNIEGILLGLAAGAFLVVVLHDLIPHSVKSSIDKKDTVHTTKHLMWFAFGVMLMSLVTGLVPHEEPIVKKGTIPEETSLFQTALERLD